MNFRESWSGHQRKSTERLEKEVNNHSGGGQGGREWEEVVLWSQLCLFFFEMAEVESWVGDKNQSKNGAES